MDPAADGADLDVEDRADLLVGETLDVAQHHDRPEGRSESGQSGGHVVIEIGVGQLLRRSRPGARQPVLAALAEAVEANLLLTPRPVEEQVGGDPMQPAFEGPGLEAVHGAEDADEHVLGQILRVVGFTGQPIGEAVDASAVIADDVFPARRGPPLVHRR